MNQAIQVRTSQRPGPLLKKAIRTVEQAADLLVDRWGPDVLQGRHTVQVQIDRDPEFAGGACWADGVLEVSALREPGARQTVAGSLDTMLHELGHGHFDPVTPGGGLQILSWWDRALVELGADLIALGARPGGADDWRLFDDGSSASQGCRELGQAPGFLHARELPTGSMLGPGMQNAQYSLASLLGGVVRDAVEAGVPEHQVVDAWVEAIADSQRGQPSNHQQTLRQLRQNTVERLEPAAAQRMRQAWDGRGLTSEFMDSWSKPSSAAYR